MGQIKMLPEDSAMLHAPMMRWTGVRNQLLFLAFVLLGVAPSLRAQDTRNVSEPVFPPTCAVLHAPLRSNANGPVIGPGVDEQDAESEAELGRLTTAMGKCTSGYAVELALGRDQSHNAFLFDPITVPAGVSLIVDGGVTVYASRDPQKYQDPTTYPDIICGTYGDFAPLMGCTTFLSFGDNSGLYGYGVIDGQGDKLLIAGQYAYQLSWWDLTAKKIGTDKSINQASPLVIDGGDRSGATADNLILYKITIRNPPFHTVRWGGNGLTVWGVKIQAPWNVTNTDGFDLHGTNATLYDTTVSNGDDDIAFATSNGPTSNMTVDHFRTYARDGITVLGDNDASAPISHLLIENVTQTGDLPSVVGTTVNGVPESKMIAQYGLTSYGQALPNATGDVHGINIKPQVNSKGPSQISDVTFKSICMQDVEKTINIVPQTAISSLPTVDNILYQDIHVLPPTSQFLLRGVTSPVGLYEMDIEGDFQDGTTDFVNHFTFDNVVFDPLAPTQSDNGAVQSSVGLITAVSNQITTTTNVYPALLNTLDQSSRTVGNTKLVLGANTYVSKTSTSSRFLAQACGSRLPFTSGEVYLSQREPARGEVSNLQQATVKNGGGITLNAVVQPVMSQTTRFVANIYGQSPGLLAIGSPALTNPVLFYEGTRLLGSARLSANGTLATFVLRGLSPGTHTYTAEYPKDAFYDTLRFGSVTVKVE
jgi:polygalacturonase